MSTIVTLEQLAMAADASMTFHMDKGSVFWQNKQNRPLYNDFRAAQKTYPGGKGLQVDVRVAGEFVTRTEGFQYDQSVSFGNPAKIRTASYAAKLIHAGINVTKHELLENGISLKPSASGDKPSPLARADAIQLANIFDYKMEDMQLGWEKDVDEMYWGDGTLDPNKPAGVRSIIVPNPSAALVVGGLDQYINDKWRNYAALSLNVSTPSNKVLSRAMQIGFRQMRRYGTPKWKIYAGSDFIDAYEQEARASGYLTQTGWQARGKIDMSVADSAFDGNEIVYAPTLDDLGLSKYCYVIDTSKIYPMVIEGEDMQQHSPERPPEKYVLYRAITSVFTIVARQRNTSGVFSIA